MHAQRTPPTPSFDADSLQPWRADVADYLAKRSRPACLYRFFDADGALLYVGITASGVNRWAAHSATARWWPEVRTVTVEHVVDRYAAEQAEVAAIRAEHPRYNRALVKGPAPRPPRVRRSHHEGSIFQRKSDGRWTVVFSDPNGVRTLYCGASKRRAQIIYKAALDRRRVIGLAPTETTRLAVTAKAVHET